jgi:hypothetical protein
VWPESLIEVNKEKEGCKDREHVVPLAFLRDKSFEMFWAGKNTDDVVSMLERNLWIAFVPDRSKIDQVTKATMPDGWKEMKDNPFERLIRAGVKILEPRSNFVEAAQRYGFDISKLL